MPRTPRPEQPDQLASLLDAVLASPRYRSVSRDLILHIGSQELTRQRSLKEAIKATKNKLHQVGGAYLDTKEHYTMWLDELRTAAQSGNQEQLLQACRNIMSHHASTRERLPILDRFYAAIFANLPPVYSVLDIACGLNPLAIPWMSLPENTQYYAYDIYHDIMDFLNEWMSMLPIHGYAHTCDVLQSCPSPKADVAFLLKAIPCLEQLDKSAGSRLLHSINADHLVVSFPIHSLGGKNKGMPAHYESHFHDLIHNEPWEITKLTFESEFVFIMARFMKFNDQNR